ncbi:MAG: radical SAM protein [Calditrichaeota bacterium]|nr:radical SAM protein [Calditrichota bacterium]
MFRKIIENFSDKKLQLSAMNGILADSLDEELISLMKKAGFDWLNIPLVSGSDEVQRKIGRRQNREHFVQVIKWARKYDLKIVAYLILGLPEDTLDQILDDIIFLAQMPVLIGPSVFYPPPEAETFENCVRQNYISGKDFSLYRSTAYSVETENFTRKDLVTLFRLVRLINYWKGAIDQNPAKDFAPKSELIFKTENDFMLESTEKLSPLQIAEIITANLIERKIFLGVRKLKFRTEKFAYQFFLYVISDDVLGSFMRKIKGIEISGVIKGKMVLTKSPGLYQKP